MSVRRAIMRPFRYVWFRIMHIKWLFSTPGLHPRSYARIHQLPPPSEAAVEAHDRKVTAWFEAEPIWRG